jgi:hypothetical protein
MSSCEHENPPKAIPQSSKQMYFFMGFESATNQRTKIWEITETRQRGWVRLSWTYTKDDGVLAPRQNASPGEFYTGRLVRVFDQDGIPHQTVKIFAPMGTGGRDDWHYTNYAQTLEEIQ